jgi:hypothetical protein
MGQDMGATPENKSQRSAGPSALTAGRQAKNIRAKCLECGAKRKVTVHVSAHDRYFFFDVPMPEIWPNITGEDAGVLEAHKRPLGCLVRLAATNIGAQSVFRAWIETVPRGTSGAPATA